VPAEVVPDPMDMSLDKAEAALVAKELRTLLEEAVPLSCALPKVTLPNYDNVPGNLMLSALGLRLGDRVLLDGQKVWGGRGGGGTQLCHLGDGSTGQEQTVPFVCHLPVIHMVRASFVPHPVLSSEGDMDPSLTLTDHISHG
jgi:hypothetical protein